MRPGDPKGEGLPPGELSMSKRIVELGQRRTLSNRLKKTLAACAVFGLFGISGLAPVVAGGETRTISLYHIHTGESLNVTYMKDGHYIPSAMKQINYLLRDWRRNKTITIDPRTIDLVWELHEDLGSHSPVHIVCGYRSAQTNALLHRIGRHVARESQHINGKAIDFYLTDVPTMKIRNTALVRQIGGVGYYRSAGGPTGFLHVDSGHVRHWGPYISPNQLAQIFRDGQKTVGRRLRMNHGNATAETAVASNDANPPGFISKLLGLGKKPAEQSTEAPAPVQMAATKPADAAANAAYKASADDMADLSADAATPPVKPVVKPKGTAVSDEQMASLGDLAQDAATAPKQKLPKPPIAVDVAAADDGTDEADVPDATVKQGRVVPKPRLKPNEIMLMAAANMKAEPKMIRINAASAPPPSQTGKDMPSPVADSLGTLMQAAADEGATAPAQKSATKTKSSLANELRNGSAKGLPVIRPMIASAGGSDINWWPQLFLQNDAAIRRDGQPPLIGSLDQDAMPKAANIGTGNGASAFAADLNQAQHTAEGKGDLTVNEEDKVDLDPAPLPMKVGALNQ
jgi:uncharacterized protein YcbK (DUF882 family)